MLAFQLHPFEFFIDISQGQAESSDAVNQLEMGVSEYEARAKVERAEADEQRVFRVWNDLLEAKAEGERQKETLLPYQSAEVRGQYIVFRLVGQLPDTVGDIVGQPWRVKLQGAGALGGVVADMVDGDRLHLQIKYGDSAKLPRQGVLTFDITAAQTNLKRERTALDAVRFNRAVRHDLGRLLVHPETAKQPIACPNIEFRQDLDEAKQNAVRAALGSEDCLAVEGPPGTGKTRFIAELVLQYLKKHPTSRVLVTSQTHVALDNAIERIAVLDATLNIVRVARSEDPRVSPAVEPLTIENQLRKWTVEVIGRGKQFLTSWAMQRGVRQDEVELSAVLRRLSYVLEQIEAAESEVARLREADDLQEGESVGQMLAREEELSRLTIALASRRKARQALQKELRDRGFEELAARSRPEIDEWANALLGDSAEATRFLALLRIHAEWVEGFGKGPEFHAALLARTQVVSGTCIGMAGVDGWDDLEFDLCILDEASKATATEALVPMSRSRSWVVVGDPQQLPPFQHEFLRDRDVLQDYNLTPGDFKETILNRFLAHLPQDNRHYLNVQHRMIAPIGNLISHCFYKERGLLSPRTDSDPLLLPVLPRPVTWYTTARLTNRREQELPVKKFVNRSEVDAIRQILGRLNAAVLHSGRNYRVAVLTGYAEQRQTIERAVRPELRSWGSLSVECNTVHAIQGREAQIAIYSVTRSNPLGKIGFLRETELLNVALSRAEFGLVIVGDHHFCGTVMCDNPLGRVLEYVEGHPEDCALLEVSG